MTCPRGEDEVAARICGSSTEHAQYSRSLCISFAGISGSLLTSCWGFVQSGFCAEVTTDACLVPRLYDCGLQRVALVLCKCFSFGGTVGCTP